MALVKALGVDVVFDRRNRTPFGGSGRLAGDAPPEPSDPADPDGRAKVMNVPSRVDISILQPFSHVVVARTMSRRDGTWEVRYLDTSQPFTVVGTDLSRTVNSAIQDWVYPVEMD